MPDYDLSDPNRVKVRIIGKILDERFTRMLMSRTGLDLGDVILLDKVQKGLPISEDAYRSLKHQGLIEGRKAAPFISAAIAAVAEQEAEYILNKGIDKEDCKRKVIDYLKQFSSARRLKFVAILTPHLSTMLNDRQKRDFVKNLLQVMRRDGTIRKTINGTRGAEWELSKPTTEDVT
jgi:ATP-dependent DNA helicase RecG